MEAFLEASGVFVYPLGLCSVLGLAIILERLWALRRERVLPARLETTFFEDETSDEVPGHSSVAGRILDFWRQQQPSAAALKAFAAYEVARLERGMFVLEMVIGAAPLLGLMGTVWGLYKVMSGFSVEGGMPDPSGFVENLGLALTTTFLGLAIALPALLGSLYLQRRVDMFAAELGVGVERLCQRSVQADRS